MKNPRISFLIAAHNEEKMIAKPLKNLLELPYDNYEVIIGLDGCTDDTETIVRSFCKKSKKIRYYKLNLRQGKPVVINEIIKNSTGDIIIIQDSDWIFQANNKKAMIELISAFEDKKVGGIAESFPIQYPLKKNAGLLEIGIMLQNSIWMDYLKEKGQKIDHNWSIADEYSSPLLVNIFLKKLYKPNVTLGDDFERFYDIIHSGKVVLTTNNPNIPRLVSAGERYTFRGLIKQKERTALARNQLRSIKKSLNLISFKFLTYTAGRFFKMNLKQMLCFFIVNFAFLIGAAKSKFNKNTSTKDGWKMRQTR